MDRIELGVEEATVPQPRSKDGLYMRLDMGDIHVEDRSLVAAVGKAFGGAGYLAVATSDGQIRFLVGSGAHPESWRRIPFLDFTIGDENARLTNVAIGGDCSGNSHPTLLAYSRLATAWAFRWNDNVKQWQYIGQLKGGNGFSTQTIDQLRWERSGYGADKRWSLYAGGEGWGHQRLRPRRWYEVWYGQRWVCTKL